jgi:hypothetical protein
MEKNSTRKKRAGSYSEALLTRFKELYENTPNDQLDVILHKEFPQETKNRKGFGPWRSLAHRLNLRKGSAKAMDEIVVNVIPSTPDVEVPSTITFGKIGYPVALLRSIGVALQHGEPLGGAYRNLAKEFGIIADNKHIPSLTNFFRMRFNATIPQFKGMPTQQIEETLQKELRVELVRRLRNDKWRDSAIIEKSAELFPEMEPLQLEEVRRIKNFWRAGKRERTGKRGRPRLDTDIVQAPVVRNLAKKDDLCTFSINGPTLNYTEKVPLAKAKNILKIVLTEDNK